MQVLLDPVYTSLYDTQFLTEEQKIHGVLLLLRGMRLSVLDLVTKILGDRPEYKSWKDGLFKGRGFEFFFDAMARDKRGSKVIERKFNGTALHMTVKVIEKEMKVVKKLMRMTMNEVTPEFLYAFNLESDVTRPFTTASPSLQTVLLAATQSPKAIQNNTRETTPVSLFFHNRI